MRLPPNLLDDLEEVRPILDASSDSSITAPLEFGLGLSFAPDIKAGDPRPTVAGW